MKTLIHLSLTVLALSVPFSVHARTPEEDFTARCTAPGVVKCYGFDNTSSDIVQKQNLFPDGLGVFRGGLDTDQKASGAGSLRFALPPPPHAGANIAGKWMGLNNTPILGQTFSQNSTFYLQFRLRLSPEMLTNSWPADNSYKIINIFHNGVTYGPIEFTTSDRYRTGVLIFSSHGGSLGLFADPTTGAAKPKPSPPYLLQQGDYNCRYGIYNTKDCFYLTANEWITFYYRVSVGTWGQPNSIVQVWVMRKKDTAYKQVINLRDYTFYCNTAPCDKSPGKDAGFNNLYLSPYMTRLDPNAGDPGVTSYIWYDELIVSTQPIAAPTSNGTWASHPMVIPTAPRNLSLKYK
jgi:hypothetical protein